MISFRVINGGIKSAGGAAMPERKLPWYKRMPGLKVDNNISYRTLGSTKEPSGLNVASCSNDVPPKSDTIVPISNIPDSPVSDSDKEGGLPSKRDFTIYRLKRQVSSLRQNEKQLLAKLTRCQEIIADQKRFIDIGLTYDQWETMGELKQRQARLEAALQIIDDPNCNIQIDVPEKERVKL